MFAEIMAPSVDILGKIQKDIKIILIFRIARSARIIFQTWSDPQYPKGAQFWRLYMEMFFNTVMLLLKYGSMIMATNK